MTIEPNDPTRSGPPLPAGGAASLSQNEIRALCLKAARGAGMDWGIAEEAGSAAAWLSERGLDGPGALLDWLSASDRIPAASRRPEMTSGSWRPSDDGPMCPITLGAALCDFADLPEAALSRGLLRLGPVGRPVLLLPFLSGLGAAQGSAVRIDWPGGTVAVDGRGALSGDAEALRLEPEAVLTIAGFRAEGLDRTACCLRPAVGPDTLRGLDDLAMRTTVPPSEASRAGAGAATSDND
ncbi:MAG: DUF3726 domain-containing protein [Rhodobacteraceae bacterium]|nr:DUF3726 domain-containing protein [Paracoccaceae bacterium]